MGVAVSARALVAVAACAIAGCDVGAAPLEGKACPCAGGFVCDDARNVCVLSLASIPDASVDVPAPQPRVLVSNLRAAFTTANNVHWRWDVTGDPSDFARYEIVTGPSEQTVRARAPGTRTWRPADNPELGNIRGLDRTLNGDPFDPFTTTDEHAPATPVYAQVHAVDTAGATASSNVVVTQTTNPTSQTVIFSDADMAGASTPAGFARSTDRPYRGTHCYALKVSCPAGAASCYQKPERARIAVGTGGLDQAAFDTAFLEFAVSGDAAVSSFYSDVLVQIGGDTCPGGAAACRYTWEGWTFPGPDRFRLVQVPLRVLARASDQKRMTFTDFSAARGQLHAIAFRGTWANGSTARFDEIRVRY